jgi:hexosaminidase
MNAAKTRITGSMVGQRGSKFDITLGGKQIPSSCTPPPGPTPPGPAPAPKDNPAIWPMPRAYTNGDANVTITPSSNFLTVEADTNATPFLTAAAARYLPLIFPHSSLTSSSSSSSSANVSTSSITTLQISVTSSASDFPQLETDETYTLSIPATGGAATLHAKTVYGALRGLETFSQLVTFDFDTESYEVMYAPWSINDSPRFPHRGLMIDTARHFETLDAIRKIIDSLPYAKLNVLHWHMSDSQSFPLQVKSHPKLWDGSWSLQERYLQSDVAEMVEYARMRGVRVMVEFDMPGHAEAWCTGYPEICPSSTCQQPLNVANNATFDLIDDLLKEVTGGVASKAGKPSPGLFKDNFVHLGGDEVNTDCWVKTASVAAWLKEHDMTADQGYAYFTKRVAEIAIKYDHRPVQWSEVYDHFKTELDKKTIVHIWKSNTNVTEVVANGYQTLVNVGYDSKSWYLDNLNVKWDAVYSNEPCAGVPDALCPMVIGGHGEMWGETVDASDIEQTVWPRLGAIAERLWSNRNLTQSTWALPRIEKFRCLLNRRGVAAAPVLNSNARSSPPGPGSCYRQ